MTVRQKLEQLHYYDRMPPGRCPYIDQYREYQIHTNHAAPNLATDYANHVSYILNKCCTTMSNGRIGGKEIIDGVKTNLDKYLAVIYEYANAASVVRYCTFLKLFIDWLDGRVCKSSDAHVFSFKIVNFQIVDIKQDEKVAYQLEIQAILRMLKKHSKNHQKLMQRESVLNGLKASKKTVCIYI